MQYINVETVRLIPSQDAAAWYWNLVLQYDEVVEKTKENKAEINKHLKQFYNNTSWLYDDNISTFKSDYLGCYNLQHYKQLANFYNRMVVYTKSKMLYEIDRVVLNNYDIKTTSANTLIFEKERYGRLIKKKLNCASCLKEMIFDRRAGSIKLNLGYTNKIHQCKTCTRFMCVHCKHFVHCWFCKYEFDNGIKEKPKPEKKPKKDKKVIIKRNPAFLTK